jgi:hypothetical protein
MALISRKKMFVEGESRARSSEPLTARGAPPATEIPGLCGERTVESARPPVDPARSGGLCQLRTLAKPVKACLNSLFRLAWHRIDAQRRGSVPFTYT